MAAPAEPNFLAPQIRFEWVARPRAAGGFTLTFELGRILRLCRLVCIVLIPSPLAEGKAGEGYLRFHLDRSQEDPPTGRRPR